MMTLNFITINYKLVISNLIIAGAFVTTYWSDLISLVFVLFS